MKGLILKEFYTIKEDIINFILVSLVLILVYKFWHVPFAELIVAFVCFLLFITTYEKNEMLNNKNNYNIFLKILPINSNKIILTKYLFSIFVSLIILSICFIYSLFNRENIAILNNIKYYFGYFFVFNFTILYFPISYLIFICLKENLLAVSISMFLSISFSLLINILLLVLFINIFSINSIENIFEILGEKIFLIPSLINTFICSIIGYLFYKLTCLKYKNIQK